VASGIPTKPPTITARDWGAWVRQFLGDDFHKRDPAYEFDPEGTKRKFEDSGGASGIYSGTGA
jgi:hypothetical protein